MLYRPSMVERAVEQCVWWRACCPGLARRSGQCDRTRRSHWSWHDEWRRKRVAMTTASHGCARPCLTRGSSGVTTPKPAHLCDVMQWHGDDTCRGVGGTDLAVGQAALPRLVLRCAAAGGAAFFFCFLNWFPRAGNVPAHTNSICSCEKLGRVCIRP